MFSTVLVYFDKKKHKKKNYSPADDVYGLLTAQTNPGYVRPGWHGYRQVSNIRRSVVGS